VRCSERLRGKNRRDYTTLDRVGFLSPEEFDRRPLDLGVGVVSKRIGVAHFPAIPMTTYGPDRGGTTSQEAPIPTDGERLHRGWERTPSQTLGITLHIRA
jgi:hypothetical protein